MLLYDRETDSLWSQIKSEAVTGPMTGAELTRLPSTLTTWKKWRKKHPATLVLSTETGHSRDYTRDSYASYFKSPNTFFGIGGSSMGVPDKELVVGIKIGDEARAYPYKTLLAAPGPIEETVGGKTITISVDADSEEVRITEKDGERVDTTLSYWYVWRQFHPKTTVFKAKK